MTPRTRGDARAEPVARPEVHVAPARGEEPLYIQNYDTQSYPASWVIAAVAAPGGPGRAAGV